MLSGVVTAKAHVPLESPLSDVVQTATRSGHFWQGVRQALRKRQLSLIEERKRAYEQRVASLAAELSAVRHRVEPHLPPTDPILGAERLQSRTVCRLAAI